LVKKGKMKERRRLRIVL